MKKYVLIPIVLILIIFNFSVCYANSFNDLLDTKYEGVVDGLAYLKIVDGVSKNIFDANKVVTRAEMAKMLVIAHGYDRNKIMLDAPASFKDVKEGTWYYGYVNLASAYGLLKGYPDGNFYPDQKVTYAECVAMVLRSLGHGYIKEDSEFGWEYNYIQRMRDIKLNKGMEAFENSSGAKRGEVAILIWNMLNSTKWDMVEEDGIGQFEFKDSGKKIIDISFEEEIQLIADKRITGLSSNKGKMSINVEEIGTCEIDGILPFYVLGSQIDGIYNKKDKKCVVVTYDTGIGIVDGRAQSLKDDGYKIKTAKNKYYLGGKGEDYVFLGVSREGSNEVIERAIILDLDGKIDIKSQSVKDKVLTINDSYTINTEDAILLDNDMKISWGKLKEKDSIFPIVNGEIYILANSLKTQNQIENEESPKGGKKDNLYYISEVTYHSDDSKSIEFVSDRTSKDYSSVIILKSLKIGDLVFVTVEDGKVTRLERASSKKYSDLKLDQELILDYKDKTYFGNKFGKYTVDDSTNVCIVNKRYKTNTDDVIEKCTIEKVDKSELQYVDDEIVNIIAKENLAKTIYIERETNKFDKLYAKVKTITIDKGNVTMAIVPVGGVVNEYKVTGMVECEENELISYEIVSKDTIKINEIYHTSAIGYSGDLVVENLKGKSVILTNGDSFDKSMSAINVNGKTYKLNGYVVINAQVKKIDGEWNFTSLEFSELNKIKFTAGTRIAIDELEGTIVVYSGYKE